MKVKLGDYIQEYSVRNKDDEDIPVYSVTNTQGFCKDYFGKEVASKNKTNYKIVPYGCFAYNPSRINVGSVDWQKAEDRVIVSPLYNVFSVSKDLDQQYLYYYLKSDFSLQLINAVATGSVRHNLKLSMLSEFPIDVPSMDKQQNVVRKLDTVRRIIESRKQELQKLDELTKARFVEMFGDPIANTKGWPMVTIADVAEIKIGPFGSLLHKDDYIIGGHALVNPSHIQDGKICIDPKLTVSEEKYKELSAYRLQKGDVVLGRRGEMGRCAVVNEDGMICGTGSLIIRPGKKMKAYFLQNIISSPGYKSVIEDKAVGVTMKNLNVPIVSSLQIPLLPVNLQIQFIDFLHQVDRLKIEIQKSLDKTQMLFDSLMQTYFS